ncbi:uncharacterized protein DUF3515 [Saccharothrix carnea]|uniref:Uncharacterized protein DUF3515 n=1 Tax=Saccharothrix carnea TaxID=1280637 RepID=A0A2P8III7_SACCR|nr:DUF3515 domain-containing protein [Saccharothrix carnea]PSL58267.1 uncharacterized protein DUF3515 [Saccharothrix carnea]
MAQEPERTSPLPRPLLALAIGLTALLAVGVAAAGLFLGGGDDEPAVHTGPVALVPLPAPEAESDECKTLLGALPAELVSNGVPLPRRELAAPAPAGASAWGDPRHEPVVLRCGLDRPGDLTTTSVLRMISEVEWLEVAEGGSATWYVVDRPVYVALTVPSDAGTGPLQDISATIRGTLAKSPVDTTG